jgi:hypothetical protein
MSAAKQVIILAALIVMSLAAYTPVEAKGQTVFVSDAGGVTCTLDTETIQWDITLTGHNSIDFWVEYRLSPEACGLFVIMSDGQPEELDFARLCRLKVRYLFRVDNHTSSRLPAKVVLEKIYTDSRGEVLLHEKPGVPRPANRWFTLDSIERQVLQALVAQRSFLPGAARPPAGDLLAGPAGGDGMLGYPWGAPSTALCGVPLTGSLNLDDMQVLMLGEGWTVGPNIAPAQPVRLIFTREHGLVAGSIPFAASRQQTLAAWLQASFGSPSTAADGRQTWKASAQTLIVLDPAAGGVGRLLVMARGFPDPAWIMGLPF